MGSRLRNGVVAILVAVAGSAACGKADPEEHLRRGNEYVEQSRLDEAVLEYRSALAVAPGRGDIRLKLGDLYMRQTKLGEALGEYVRAADIRTTDVLAQIKAGSLLLLARRFEDAKARAEKAIAADPKNADAQILLGNAMAGLKDMDGALAEYQEALTLNPAQGSAYTNIGAIQFARGQKTEAEAAFRKAIEVAPTSVQARLALVNFLWASNRAPEAEQVLKDTLAQEPANISANRALGLFYLAAGRAKEAEPHFQAIAKAANTPAATLALADYYAIQKRFDEASNILRDLASKDETYAAATTRLAAIDVANGSRAEALNKLRAILEKKPKEMSARLMTARLLLIDGKRDEALIEATRIVTDEPDSPASADAYGLIGNIQFSLDRREESIRAFEEVLKRQSQPLAAQLALAGLNLATMSLEAAKTHAQQALVIQPKNPAARALLVRIYLAQNDLPRANAEIATLQKEFPNAPAVLLLVAAQQMAAKKPEAARATYTKAAQLSPNDLEPMIGLVQIDLAAGRVKDAVSRIEAGLKAPKPSPNFLMLAGQTYAAAGDFAKAEEQLKRAIEADPARLAAYGFLGGLYVRQKRLDDAIAQYRAVTERNPKSVPGQTMLAMLFEAQQRIPDAEKQYQKVLAIDANAAVAANNLAWIYVASDRNLPEALQLAQTAQQKLPDQPQINDTLGWIYYKQKQATRAIRHLEMSIEKDATDPSVHYHLGMAYALAGETGKARTSLQRALSMKPDFDGAAEARKTLADLGK